MARQFAVIPFRALQDPRLQPSDKLILAALGGHTDTSGRCWPSVETIATLSGLQERSVFRSLKRLAETGYLQMEPRAGRSTKYRVLFDTPDIMSPLTPESGAADIMSPTPDMGVTHNEYKNVDKDVEEDVLVAASGYLSIQRKARVGILRSLRQGMIGMPVPRETLVRALNEMHIANAPFTANVLRGFARKAQLAIEGEAGATAAQSGLDALRGFTGHPDTNQRPSGWAEDEVEG